MIIRSQDKRGFVNFKNIDTVSLSIEWGIVAFNGNAKSYLGQYSTKEKAIKVLDMIQERYQAIWEEENCLACGGNRISSVFQMPQDSEV